MAASYAFGVAKVVFTGSRGVVTHQVWVLIAAVTLAELIPPIAVRLRRDFRVLLGLTPPATAEENKDAHGMLSGLRYLLRDRLLGTWTVAITIGDAAFQVVFIGVPVLVLAHYGRNPRLAGLLFAAWGGGAVLGNIVSYRFLSTHRRLRLVAALAMFQALPLWSCSAGSRLGAGPGVGDLGLGERTR